MSETGGEIIKAIQDLKKNLQQPHFGLILVGQSPKVLQQKNEHIYTCKLTSNTPVSTIIVYTISFNYSMACVSVKDVETGKNICSEKLLTKETKSVEFHIVGYTNFIVTVNTNPSAIHLSVNLCSQQLVDMQTQLQKIIALDKCCEFLGKSRKSKNIIPKLKQDLEEGLNILMKEAAQVHFLAITKLRSLKRTCQHLIQSRRGKGIDALLIWAQMMLSRIEKELFIPFMDIHYITETMTNFPIELKFDNQTIKAEKAEIANLIIILLHNIQDNALDLIQNASEYQIKQRKALNAKVHEFIKCLKNF